jgi:hypothetical protein
MRNKFIFLLGYSVSLCGDWLGTVALGWLIVQDSGLGEDRGQDLYAISRALTATVIVFSSGIAGVALHRYGPFVVGIVSSAILFSVALANFGLASSSLQGVAFVVILLALRFMVGMTNPARDSSEQLVLKAVFRDLSKANWIRGIIYYTSRAIFALLA